MKENVFTVDLGDLKLSNKQRREINASIQSAVTDVLANKISQRDVVLFPINKWPRGPIIWGIIARDRDRFGINNNDLVGLLK